MKGILLFLASMFLLSPRFSAAQQDSALQPSMKIFLNVSPALLTGWDPDGGRLYSQDWYEHEEANNKSGGFHCGIIAAKRIFSSAFFIATGAEWSSYGFGHFRLSPASDPRYSNPNNTTYDTSYGSYNLKSLHVPVYFQIPLTTKNIYFALRAGIVNDFSYAEEYTIYYKQFGGGNFENSAETIKNSGMQFNAMRFHTGCDLELRLPGKQFAVLFATSITSGPLSGKSKEYFLSYNNVYSLTFGIGYFFKGK